MSKSNQRRSERIDETTISLFGENSTSETQRTYIIFGVARGGTTMVAGVSKLCGLDIGQDLPINMEDNDFNLHELNRQGIKPVLHIMGKLDERKKTKDVWGWKFPRAVAYLTHIRKCLVNPHLILVSRDPFATATRAIMSGTPQITAVEQVLRMQTRNIELIKEWEVPTLLVSYEKSIQYPDQFIVDLCRFLKVDAPADTSEILTFMQPGEYKSL